MDVEERVRAVIRREQHERPNHYVANTMVVVMAVMLVCLVLNEAHVFALNATVMRATAGGIALITLCMCLLAFGRRTGGHPATRFLMMVGVLEVTQLVAIMLNTHVVLVLAMPLLLSCLYRDRSVAVEAIVGTMCVCIVSPILAYRFGTFHIDYLTGYIETICRVTVSIAEVNRFTFWEAVGRMLVYLVLPRCLILATFSTITLVIARHGRESFLDHLAVIRMEEKLQGQVDTMQQIQDKVLYAFADLIDSRDAITGGHVRRVAKLTRILMDHMLAAGYPGVTEEYADAVVKAAPMHDVGKITVADDILLKPGPLTPAEWEMIHQHPVRSEEILKKTLPGIEKETFIRIACNVARYHHERMDGSGYPDGLKGEAIPLEARVLAIADVYDSLASERSYKEAVSPQEATAAVLSEMGTHFDAGLKPYFEAASAQMEAEYAR